MYLYISISIKKIRTIAEQLGAFVTFRASAETPARSARPPVFAGRRRRPSIHMYIYIGVLYRDLQKLGICRDKQWFGNEHIRTLKVKQWLWEANT